MDAKICDRCGEMWYDNDQCDIYITSISMTKGPAFSDRIGTFDLCNECEKGLFEYLKPLPNYLLVNGKGDKQ